MLFRNCRLVILSFFVSCFIVSPKSTDDCQCKYDDLVACENANSDACAGDASDVCASDRFPSTNHEACFRLHDMFCFSGVSCQDKCTSQYKALAECLSIEVFGCGHFNCGDNGAGDGSFCFSGDMTAEVLGQGSVQMENLKVGDLVLTGSPGHFKYQPIYAFGHLNKEVVADFYAISTEGNHVPLEITGEHLVYLAKELNPARADSLRVGDVLLSINGTAEITAIEMVKKTGLYNPLTADGRLMVNDIAVSSYIAFQETNQEHYQVVFGSGGEYKIKLVSHQTFAHLYLTPFRILCISVPSQLCQALDDEGIPSYISLGIKLVHWVGEQGVLVQLVFLLLTVPICVALLAMEKLVGSSLSPLATFAIAILAMRGNVYQEAHIHRNSCR